jgi:beta-N-acetylhexosaminidase
MAAGCDLVLHCNGKPDEMREVAASVDPLSAAAQRRVARAEAERTKHVQPIDRAALESRLNSFARAGDGWGRSR